MFSFIYSVCYFFKFAGDGMVNVVGSTKTERKLWVLHITLLSKILSRILKDHFEKVIVAKTLTGCLYSQLSHEHKSGGTTWTWSEMAALRKIRLLLKSWSEFLLEVEVQRDVSVIVDDADVVSSFKKPISIVLELFLIKYMIHSSSHVKMLIKARVHDWCNLLQRCRTRLYRL